MTRDRSRVTWSALAATGLLAGAVVLPLPRLLPTVAQATTVIIQEGEVQREDLYAFGSRVLIEGVVEGDLVFTARTVVVTGRVDGDVLGVATDRVVIDGEVGGSVRVTGRTVEVGGTVADDVVAVSWSLDLSGDIGRDVLLTTGGSDVSGTVGRDVRGQSRRLRLDGTVERSVDVSVGSLTLGENAVVGGDVAYRSNREADVAAGAQVDGVTFRRDAEAQLWRRAVGRIIGLASVLGLIVAGIALAWLLRGTWARAAAAAVSRPLATAAAGVAFVGLAPLAVVLLALTLVGIPLAVVLALLWLVALFLGPIPVLAGWGERLLRGRGGLLGGFVAGVLLWRGAVWLLPVGGLAVYGAAVVWGSGAWLLGGWEARRSQPAVADPFLLGAADPAIPDGWEPPLAPEPGPPDSG